MPTDTQGGPNTACRGHDEACKDASGSTDTADGGAFTPGPPQNPPPIPEASDAASSPPAPNREDRPEVLPSDGQSCDGYQQGRHCGATDPCSGPSVACSSDDWWHVDTTSCNPPSVSTECPATRQSIAPPC
ncbi:MAG TPA: hypothetical protein VHM70_01615 [Polyangiaceae bacterium]|nr:hypothetical protein [Polyangiaceae bacterium]